MGSSLASEFYYKVEGKNTNTIKTLSFAVDERVPNYSQIVVIDSKFNNQFKVTGIGTNVFKFNPTGIAETTSYTSSGFSSAFYSTKSLGEIGGIHSINVLNKGFNVDKLPIITSIETTNGENAVFQQNNNQPYDTIPNGFRIEDITPFGQNKSLKGNMQLVLSPFYNFNSNHNDSIRFSILLIDRNLNHSNVVYTPVIKR